MEIAEDGPRGARELVESLCRSALDGAAGRGLTGVAVSRCAQARYAGVMFASDPVAARLETLQEVLGEGPGPTALATSAPVLVPDLTSAPQAATWLEFVPTAVDLGVSCMFAFPVSVGASGVGLLTVHGGQPMPLAPSALMNLLRLSDAVGTALLAPPRDGDAATDRAELLDDVHTVTHQAVGMVSVQLDCSLEDAMAALRAFAFANEVPLVDVARDVVERRRTFRDRVGGSVDEEEDGDERAGGERHDDDQ